jgi:hypothetical protein
MGSLVTERMALHRHLPGPDNNLRNAVKPRSPSLSCPVRPPHQASTLLNSVPGHPASFLE